MHIRRYFENYTLGEITTGRVETFLKAQAAVSYSRAKHSRTLLNQLFGYALRHDVLARNPVEGTSPLRKARGAPQALTLEQVMDIRAAAAAWRTDPDRRGPKPDDKVRDLIEVLTGTSMRPGEALALRPRESGGSFDVTRRVAPQILRSPPARVDTKHRCAARR